MAKIIYLSLIVLAACILLLNCVGNDDNNGTSTPLKTWNVAEKISNCTGNAGNPQITFDNSGNAIVVWQQSDGTVTSIWASYFNGTNWGTPEQISDDEGENSSPQIAFDNYGNAIAVWAQSDGTFSSIWTNRFDGTKWGDPEEFRFDNTGYYIQGNPQIAIADDCSAIVVWTAGNIWGYSALWAIRFDGTNWGVSKIVEYGGGGEYCCEGVSLFMPQIVIHKNNSAVSIWQEYSNKTSAYAYIQAKFFDGAKWNWISTRPNGISFTYSYSPNIASNKTGNTIAVWLATVNQNGVWANSFDGTDWGGTPKQISDSALAPSNLEITMDDDDNAIAIWQQFDGTVTSIWASFLDGTSWSTPENISDDDVSGTYDPINGDSDPPDGAYSPQVAFDNTGNAIAVWYKSDYPQSNIWASFFNGTSWGTPEQISDDEGYAQDPQIALDGTGNAIAVWTQSDGTQSSIWASNFH